MANLAEQSDEARRPLRQGTVLSLVARGNLPEPRVRPGTTYQYFDNTDPRYGWLLPGWLCQERIAASGRLYKFYYDMRGNRYNLKSEVLNAWKEQGLICLDS